MDWLNEPATWEQNGDTLTVTSAPKSDFWRKTHYGFIRDSGHFYHRTMTGDFRFDVKVTGQYGTLYDQAGVMVRLDETTWLKCGIEYVDGAQFASAVVTRDFSDWSVCPLPTNPPSIWLRIKREGGTIEVQYSLDGETYSMLRLTHLTSAQVMVGPMVASPEGEGFTTVFEGMRFHSHTGGNGG